MVRKIICMLLMVATLAACGDGERMSTAVSGYDIVANGDIRPGDKVPPPTGAVILTLTGKIGNPNVGKTLQFDMDTLERIGIVAYSVEDLQAEGGTVSFQGVLLGRLLDIAEVTEGAVSLNAVALNDYAIEIPLEDIEQFPVLLATAVDGQRMSVERFGPTRIIYPYHIHPLDESIFDPRWIWQLESIEVR